MLGKLFKYDFKWLIKVVLVIYSITLLVAICTRVVGSFEKTAIVSLMEKILSGTFFSLVASTIITCMMRIWARFITNTYKDESYLTHTLPVTKSQIFNSKLLSSILSLVLSIFIIGIGLFITFGNNEMLLALKSLFSTVTEMYGSTHAVFMILAIIFIIILEFIYIAQAGIFGIIVGFRANNYKVLKSIFVAIISYGFLSGSMLVILFVFAKFNPTMMELYTTGLPSPDAFKYLIYISFTIYLFYNLLYYFASKRVFKKGVNVD